MSFYKTIEYKGLMVQNAIYTVESITIQGEQLDFFVSVRAKKGSELLSGEYYGCSYDKLKGDPEDQAYSYLKTLEFFKGVVED